MRKLNVSKLALFLCLVASCLCSNEPLREPWVTETLGRRDAAGYQICSDLNLKLTGNGGGMMGGVNNVALSFVSTDELTRPQAREKLLIALDTLLAELNSSQLVRQHSSVNPLGPEQISLSISYRLPSAEGPGPTGVVATECDGLIRYLSISEEDKPAVRLHQESIAEARNS